MNEISIYEAAGRGVDRIRMERWANKFDHLKITIDSKGLCPWIKLYAPFNEECNGRDPVEILEWDLDCHERVYVPYEGPLPDSDEYRAEAARFKGVLGNGKRH
jgi:hypothetical protein